MQKSFIKSLVIAAVTALTVMLSPNAVAQVVTSGISGVVKNDDGKPAAGATVTAVHVPTNSSYKAITNADGRITVTMPHPERSFRYVQNSWRPDGAGEYSGWFRMFGNARKWVG